MTNPVSKKASVPVARSGDGAEMTRKLSATGLPTYMRLNLAVMIGLVAIASCSRSPEKTYSSGPNLLLISVDTLRADHLSLYGFSRPTSPFLERLASTSIVFDAFHYTGGGTLPSHISMLTGLYPATHRVSPHTKRILEPERVTLAEILQAEGFRTAAFVDGGWMAGQFGFAQGFDVYDDAGGRFSRILPKARHWLRRHHNDRFFLFLHTYDVHSQTDRLPYECPDQMHLRFASPEAVGFDGCSEGRCASELLVWINEQVHEGQLSVNEVLSENEITLMSDLYDGCITYVDRELEEFVEFVDGLGVLDNTVLVITSDHGEEFAEHGMLLHHQTGFQEIARLPLLVRLPDAAHGGVRDSHLAAMVDLMPTILDILSIPIPTQIQGRSFLGTVTENRAIRDEIHMYATLRTDNWKYRSDQHELYYLPDDPTEQSNEFDQNPVVVAELEQRLRTLLREDQLRFEAFEGLVTAARENLVFDEAQIRALRSLGYVIDPGE